jgi:hypothetical protein
MTDELHDALALFKGSATIAKARAVYGIKTPEQFAEPSLFDFAAQTAGRLTVLL